VLKAEIRHFKLWLRSGTGCSFAASLSKSGRVAYESHEEVPLVPDLDARLEDYGARELTAIVLLPFVTTEVGLVEVLGALRGQSSRWKLRDRGAGTVGTVKIGVEWSTATGEISDAMGFAPLPSMPVPRRAPYFAIAAWPGSRSNPERGVKPTPRARTGEVSFLDASHGLDHEDYAVLWARTEATVAELMIVPEDDPRRYRKVAFVVDEPTARPIIFDR
jgi:hypothetical protein